MMMISNNRKLFIATSITFFLLNACNKQDPEKSPITEESTVEKLILKISSEEGGTVSNTGGTYEKGTQVVVTATPDNQFLFDSWSNGATENPLNLIVNTDMEITANFKRAQFILAVNSGQGGAVDSKGGIFESGSEVILKATPNNDFVFSHWSDNSEDNPRTVTVDGNRELTANFRNKFDIEDGYFRHIGFIDDNGEVITYEGSTFVFEYMDKEAIFCGTVYNDIASFPIFKDLGYVPGRPDNNLTDLLISRKVVHREYYNGDIRTSWLLEKIDESDIPSKKSHEEIMSLVAGKGFWSDSIYSQIDPLIPETYVIAFIKDAERHNVDLSFVDIDKVLIRFRDEGFAGLSHLSCIDDDRVEISYYTPFWNSASYFDIQNERLTVMYHELGHDILNSGHPPTGVMKQLMNTGLGDEGPIVWDDADPMFSFRRMVDDMFSGAGIIYECQNGAVDYSSGTSKKAYPNEKRISHSCFPHILLSSQIPDIQNIE